jgi:coenzyme PQQ biosynthesis protein PqqD
MSAGKVIDDTSVPRLAPHMRLRFDEARQCWTIQAPERSFLLDETARSIVQRCDGATPVGAIIDSLCALYTDAPRAVIGADVIAMIQGFVDKSVMTP